VEGLNSNRIIAPRLPGAKFRWNDELISGVKSQNTNTKLQTISKSQIQMTKTTARFDIVIWNLFGICDLRFVICDLFNVPL
jgi:hypothetical protein